MSRNLIRFPLSELSCFTSFPCFPSFQGTPNSRSEALTDPARNPKNRRKHHKLNNSSSRKCTASRLICVLLWARLSDQKDLGTTLMFTHTGHEKKGNDRQRWNVLMFKQILSTCTRQNIKRTLRTIHMMMLGLIKVPAMAKTTLTLSLPRVLKIKTQDES